MTEQNQANKDHRRAALDRLRSPQLLKEIQKCNPFGGYTMPRSEASRRSMIDTILRYEGFK